MSGKEGAERTGLGHREGHVQHVAAVQARGWQRAERGARQRPRALVLGLRLVGVGAGVGVGGTVRDRVGIRLRLGLRLRLGARIRVGLGALAAGRLPHPLACGLREEGAEECAARRQQAVGRVGVCGAPHAGRRAVQPRRQLRVRAAQLAELAERQAEAWPPCALCTRRACRRAATAGATAGRLGGSKHLEVRDRLVELHGRGMGG